MGLKGSKGSEDLECSGLLDHRHDGAKFICKVNRVKTFKLRCQKVLI
jgi:hypothetical protein